MIILKPKKKIYLGLLFSLMIGIFSIGITNTYASENSNFNINSQPIEEQAINFAKTDFEHSITSILLMENNTETDINYSFQYFQTLIIRLNIFIPSKKIQMENIQEVFHNF